MRRRQIFTLAFLLGLTLCGAFAAPKYDEPDHLEPVNPYPGDWRTRYMAEIRSRLHLEPHGIAQMIVMPSFTGEYAVRLHGTGSETDIGDGGYYFLSYSEVTSTTNIWYAMPENNSEKKQKDVTVSVTTVEISKALATRLYTTWRRMLYRTRYAEHPHTGADGVIVEFGIWCHYGRVWTPGQRKSPLLFLELGESLVGYCKAAPEERPAAEEKVVAKAALLEKYLDKHPMK